MVKREAHLITYSKSLRASQTPWENKLWRELRGNRFNGLKFKRQVPIENYIVDFRMDFVFHGLELSDL